MSKLIGVLCLGTMLGVSVLLPAGSAQAAAVGLSRKTVLPPPQPLTIYSVVNVHYYEEQANPGGPVGSCKNAGGTCSITVGDAVSTTISTSLGFSKGGVATGIGFAINRTSTTAVTCASKKLKSGEKYVAYRMGEQAMYKVKKAFQNGKTTTVTYSGWLFSWEPYKGVHTNCSVVSG